MAEIARTEGQRAFGTDPSGYDQARPDYPPRVYDILRDRCGLRPGARTFEVGPGTGVATRNLRTAIFDTGQVTRLYATFPSISRLHPAAQQRLLDELGRIADDAFGGRVERHMVTPLYTAQRG